ERDRRPVAPGTLDRLAGDEVEPDLLRLRHLLLAARKVDQLRDQRRHLGQLLDDVAEKAFAFTCRKRALTRENLDVRPQARQRRAQLVRSICDELTLSARRFLECTEHRVEAAGEPAELVAPSDLDTLGQV